MTLPRFRYHPDPIATGSAVPTADVCNLCGTARGWRYAGPIYGRQVDALCLHCIASGEASRALTVATDWPCVFTGGVSLLIMISVESVFKATFRCSQMTVIA